MRLTEERQPSREPITGSFAVYGRTDGNIESLKSELKKNIKIKTAQKSSCSMKIFAQDSPEAAEKKGSN